MTETRRDALKCLGVGAGTLFTLSGGVFSAFEHGPARSDVGTPLFLRSATPISASTGGQSHVAGTWAALIWSMPAGPGLRHPPRRRHPSFQKAIRHASQLLSQLKLSGCMWCRANMASPTDRARNSSPASASRRTTRAITASMPGAFLCCLGQCDEHKPSGGRAGRRSAGLAEGRSRRPFRQPAGGGVRLCRSGYLRTGAGNRRSEQIALLPFRFGHRAERPLHQIVQKVGQYPVPHRPPPLPNPGEWRAGPSPLIGAPTQLPGMLGVSVAVRREEIAADRLHWRTC